MYEVWIDADGKSHLIEEMDTKYIENCISQIEIVCRTFGIRESDGYSSQYVGTFPPLHREWCINYANGFLEAFREELRTR